MNSQRSMVEYYLGCGCIKCSFLLSIEEWLIKINRKLVWSYDSINQNQEFVCLNESDDWKYQLPIGKLISILLSDCNGFNSTN